MTNTKCPNCNERIDLGAEFEEYTCPCGCVSWVEVIYKMPLLSTHSEGFTQQERDRLAEKVRELEGELPGKLKGERALADEQIRCFHEQAVNVEQERDRLRAELIAWKHSAKSQDALDDENERLRGLIGALPLLTDDDIRGIELGRHFSTLWHSALATLLRERQEMEEKC